MLEKINIPAFFASLSLEPGNVLLAVLVAAGSLILIMSVLALVRRRLCALSDEQAERPIIEILKTTLASTSKTAVLFIALLIGLTVLDLPPKWDERVRHLWFIGVGIQLAVYAHRALSIAARSYFRSHADPDGSPVTVANTLIIWALRTTVWIVFILALLANLGINVSTFIASLGIGGIAIALAVQNILGDLFASLSIAIDKPFEVGDSVSVAGFSGTIEKVGLKTTRVRSDSGEQIVIGNSELLKNTVRNFKRMTNRRVQFSVKVNPATAPELAEQIPAALRAIVEAQEDVRFDRAHLKTVDQSALEFEVVYYVLKPAYAVYMDRQQAVLLAIMRALVELDVAMTTAPQQLLVRETPAHGAGSSAAPNLNKNGPVPLKPRIAGAEYHPARQN